MATPPTLTELSEAERARAAARFALLRPFLHEGVPLPADRAGGWTITADLVHLGRALSPAGTGRVGTPAARGPGHAPPADAGGAATDRRARVAATTTDGGARPSPGRADRPGAKLASAELSHRRRAHLAHRRRPRHPGTRGDEGLSARLRLAPSPGSDRIQRSLASRPHAARPLGARRARHTGATMADDHPR